MLDALDPAYLFSQGYIPITPVIFSKLNIKPQPVVGAHLLKIGDVCQLIAAQEKEVQVSTFTNLKSFSKLTSKLESGQSKNLVAILSGETYHQMEVDTCTVVDTSRHRWIDATEFDRLYWSTLKAHRYSGKPLQYYGNRIKTLMSSITNKMKVIHNLDIKDTNSHYLNLKETNTEVYDSILEEMHKEVKTLFKKDILRELDDISYKLKSKDFGYNEVIMHNITVEHIAPTTMVEDLDKLQAQLNGLQCLKSISWNLDPLSESAINSIVESK